MFLCPFLPCTGPSAAWSSDSPCPTACGQTFTSPTAVLGQEQVSLGVLPHLHPARSGKWHHTLFRIKHIASHTLLSLVLASRSHRLCSTWQQVKLPSLLFKALTNLTKSGVINMSVVAASQLPQVSAGSALTKLWKSFWEWICEVWVHPHLLVWCRQWSLSWVRCWALVLVVLHGLHLPRQDCDQGSASTSHQLSGAACFLGDVVEPALSFFGTCLYFRLGVCFQIRSVSKYIRSHARVGGGGRKRVCHRNGKMATEK